ncbi:DUF4843 domain-containing protein [Ancylomarina salipaludis]|uniref:DUF4843 domain-containing protein n=1 Tax=Ancylomarina salipaludis TaxID=2501299 RepID=A0A4Q1JJJ3_9BACT|nr:DUF4843 domain-containing protein [Ancylomarina salipaludis]RXQ91496.1 DUF4843 domain-containing protein [Ancylomarina salipaludis]
MNKYRLQYLFFLIVVLQFIGCEKNDKLLYNTEYSALNMPGLDSTSVNFMFLSDDVLVHPVKIRLTLTGQKVDYDRHYQVEIDTANTTAIEGMDFEKLQPEYVFDRNTFTSYLIVNVIKTDALKDRVAELALRLKESEDFKVGLEGAQEFKIKILNNLNEPPYFWEWQGVNNHAGAYHPLKCRKFIEISGITDEEWSPESNLELLVYVKKTKIWFEENPTYDENGKRLLFEAN